MNKFSVVLTVVVALLAGCNSGAVQPEKISVNGDAFVNESGEEIVFHGVNIRDPHQLELDDRWTKAHFAEARKWGADLIRLPVHPVAWRERGTDAYLALLDSAVLWATELDMYLIIDWHSIGNLKSAIFQHPMYNTSMEETLEFWDIISQNFSDEPVIAMYELFNEPVEGGKFGELTWDEWKGMNLEIIETIRNNDPEKVILVAGFNWAYDLTPVREDPITMHNIAYVSHPYPEKRQPPWEAQWEADWGFVAENYPVILTEIGFALPDEPGVHIPVHGDETYGNALVEFAEERGISWVVWCFDPRWSPYMFTDWDYTPTRQGEFFKAIMQPNEW